MLRIPATVALAVALAQPALATTVYVPFADRLQAGVPQQRTELRLSNNQSSIAESVTYRVFVDGRAGVAKTFLLAAGQSRTVAPGVPAGSSGLIQVNASDRVSVTARLLVERPGSTPSALSMPAFIAESAASAGATINLQGLGHGNGKETGLTIQNFDDQAATCSVKFENAEGRAIGTETQIQFPGKSAHSEENVLSLQSRNAIADAVARISCNRRFWAFAVVEETSIGESHLVKPALELSSTVTTDALTALATYTFSKSGTFLVSSDQTLNWIFRMYLPTALTFHNAIVDYDFYVNIWDPKKPNGTHELLWFQKDLKWSRDLMAYTNSTGSRGGMRMKVYYNSYWAGNSGKGLTQKTKYHMHWEWNGTGKKNSYTVYNTDGTVRTKWFYTTGAATFTTKVPFIGMGGQTSCGGCPESKTPGWTFSNLVIQLVP